VTVAKWRLTTTIWRKHRRTPPVCQTETYIPKIFGLEPNILGPSCQTNTPRRLTLKGKSNDMATTKSFSLDPKKIFLLAALAVFVGHRLDMVAHVFPIIWPDEVKVPSVDSSTLSPAQRALWQTINTLRPEDKKICGDLHAGLARAVAADPASEPVMKDTPALRRAYRAGFLYVWRGLAGNDANEYPGLSASLEAALTDAVGSQDVPLNPAIRQSAVDYFNKVAALCTNGQR